MRAFLKQHPWQIEIVPAIAFLASVGAVWFYQTKIVGYWQKLAFSSELRDTYDQFCVWAPAFILCLWVMEMSVVRKWIVTERRKRFNYLALVFQLHILITTWISVLFTYIAVVFMNHGKKIQWFFPLLVVMLLIGIGFSAFSEWKRRYTCQAEVPEPSPPTNARPRKKGVIFSDVEVDWWMIALATLFLGAFIYRAVLAEAHRVLFVLMSVDIPLLLIGFAFRIVTLSSDALVLKCCFIQKRWKISEIMSCSPAHHQFLERIRGHRSRGLVITSGRCLQFTTSDGRVYRVGMLRPAYACSLLEPLIGASNEPLSGS